MQDGKRVGTAARVFRLRPRARLGTRGMGRAADRLAERSSVAATRGWLGGESWVCWRRLEEKPPSLQSSAVDGDVSLVPAIRPRPRCHLQYTRLAQPTWHVSARVAVLVAPGLLADEAELQPGVEVVAVEWDCVVVFQMQDHATDWLHLARVQPSQKSGKCFVFVFFFLFLQHI